MRFKVIATIIKVIEVEVDDLDLEEGRVYDQEDIEELAREKAHELFSPLHDGTNEIYSEDSELLDDVVEAIRDNIESV